MSIIRKLKSRSSKRLFKYQAIRKLGSVLAPKLCSEPRLNVGADHLSSPDVAIGIERFLR